MVSELSAAKIDNLEIAFANASMSAGGAPLAPSSTARPLISSIIRCASSGPNGATRNVTSFSTSTKTPPNPNITVGPKTGSFVTPKTVSIPPGIISATMMPSILAFGALD